MSSLLKQLKQRNVLLVLNSSVSEWRNLEMTDDNIVILNKRLQCIDEHVSQGTGCRMHCGLCLDAHAVSLKHHAVWFYMQDWSMQLIQSLDCQI